MSISVRISVLLLAILASSSNGQSLTESEKLTFFEKNIRPVLVKECYSCHAKDAKRIKGGLTLDTREGIRKGGDTGPAVIPGNARRSLLMKAMRHVDDDLAMPPSKKLSNDVITAFAKWIDMGAPDPRDGKAKVVKKEEIDIEKGRLFWAFQPPKASKIPTVEDKTWPRTDIDRHLLAVMEAEGLKPVADADPYVLIRRLTFDLIGLPPSPEEIKEFVKEYNTDPDSAMKKAVDQLLSSPRFGERWGRHWLDVARFGESSGSSSNVAYPHAWRYRDYVIESFNADKPYDQFIREQLAGDLLPASDAQKQAENMIATGFLVLGTKNHNERNRRQFQMDLVDEQINVTFQAFQAMTVACARCHDHKFDPIPQTDYYALAGIFQSTESCYGTIRVIQSNQPSPLITLPTSANVPVLGTKLTATARENIQRQIEEQQKRFRDASGNNAQIQRLITRNRIATLQSRLTQYDEEGEPKALAMGVRERRFAFDSRVYHRGELDQPGERVRRGFPQVMTTSQPNFRFRSSGRLELANWIASKDNPLTARVMANRIWLHLMGQGLVGTPDNFGKSGQRPSHPELLDYLALSFIDNDWSVKKLIRQVVLSRAYQLASTNNKQNFEKDPENVYVWRMPQRRLEAEAIRDSMLWLSGRLDLDPPTGSVVAANGEGRINTRFRGADPAVTSKKRSVYLPIIRDQLPEVLTLFDFPDPSLIIGERATTTIPAQSLFLMNNSFVIKQADGMARRLIDNETTGLDRIVKAYQLCYSRNPSRQEIANAVNFLKTYGRSHLSFTTWSAFCQALIAGVEFSHH